MHNLSLSLIQQIDLLTRVLTICGLLFLRDSTTSRMSMEFLLKTWRRSKSRAIKTPVRPLPSLKKIKRLVELLHTIDTHAKIKKNMS